jgi:hypothetical protein
MDDGSGSRFFGVDRAPFPQERLTWITHIQRGCYPRLRTNIVVLLDEILTWPSK